MFITVLLSKLKTPNRVKNTVVTAFCPTRVERLRFYDIVYLNIPHDTVYHKSSNVYKYKLVNTADNNTPDRRNDGRRTVTIELAQTVLYLSRLYGHILRHVRCLILLTCFPGAAH